jgi:hypothetical protein
MKLTRRMVVVEETVEKTLDAGGRPVGFYDRSGYFNCLLGDRCPMRPYGPQSCRRCHPWVPIAEKPEGG